jgi:serine/threonine-protein kinase
LVHRDIKPANVFLCERGGVPDAIKVLDFGLVREYVAPARDEAPLTGETGFVGTPCFMPPESIQDSSKSDPRSDIYSVGALGYFLMSGKYVFDARSVTEIYQLQMTGQLPSLARRTTNLVSPQIEEVLLRCLNKDPKLRPQSVNELRLQLLGSPLAYSWGVEARAVWWTKHRVEVEAPDELLPGGTSSIPTVKIDFASRME